VNLVLQSRSYLFILGYSYKFILDFELTLSAIIWDIRNLNHAMIAEVSEKDK
jgi:hypothetical protein